MPPRAGFESAFQRAQHGLGNDEIVALDALCEATTGDEEAFAIGFAYARGADWLHALCEECVADRIVDREFPAIARADVGGALLVQFERLIDPASGFRHGFDFPDGVLRCADHVCRIEVDGKFRGTGFLVRPNLVLTAGHVLDLSDGEEPLIDEFGGASQDSHNRLRIEINNGALFRRLGRAREIPVAEDWLLACKVPKPGVDELDFALIQLKTIAGVDLTGLRPAKAMPFKKDRILVMQHPTGTDISFHEGEVKEIVLAQNRFCHSANTLGGSSGGPCVDGRFELVGVHQGEVLGAPNPALANFNAAVLIEPILRSVGSQLDTVGEGLYFDALRLEDGSLRPLIGRRETQDWVRNSIGSGSRIAAITGPRSAGKTFTTAILRTILPRDRHRIIALSADTLQVDTPRAFAARVLEVQQSHPLVPGDFEGSTTRTAWLRREFVESLVDSLHRQSGGRMVWIVLDDLAIALPQQTGIRDALNFLYEQAVVHDWLRFVLLGYEAVEPEAVTPLFERWELRPFAYEEVPTHLRRYMEERGAPGVAQTVSALESHLEGMRLLGDQTKQRLAAGQMSEAEADAEAARRLNEFLLLAGYAMQTAM